MQKIVLSLAALCVVGALAGAAWVSMRPAPELNVSAAVMNTGGTSIGGPFELTDHNGERVTSSALIDRPTLMYFGYTYCPDICPIDVQIMAETADLLAERGVDMKPVFVTIDPARDTWEELAYYAEAMHPNLVALTGTEEETAEVAGLFKVYFNRVEVPGSAAEYLFQHTGYRYLMLPGKGLTAMFRNKGEAGDPVPPEQMADDIEKLVAANR